MLSCSCDTDYDPEPGEIFYTPRQDMDFETLATKRRQRCKSCKRLINIGETVLRHDRARYPRNDIESRIVLGMWLEDAFCCNYMIPIADHYHCERCGEIYLNLTSLGFDCLMPDEDMEAALKEYHKLSGFDYVPKPKFSQETCPKNDTWFANGGACGRAWVCDNCSDNPDHYEGKR
jgi:hypothetical protein